MGRGLLVDSNLITIYGDWFIDRDYFVTKKDILLDVISREYIGQNILVICFDGENTKFSGFEQFLIYLCDSIGIPYSKVTIRSHSLRVDPRFNHEQLNLGVFLSAGSKIPTEFDRDVSNGKFVGTLIRRYNLTRLRILYELDNAFPGDNFMTFHSEFSQVEYNLSKFRDQYTNELNWLQNKQFDFHLPVTVRDSDLWETACAAYGDVWNKFKIELIAETDSLDDYWFTEKTAKCLATGKPFVLMSGQNSLKNLKTQGYKTFGDILDESYDNEATPYYRIKKIVQSLKTLYNNPARDILIQNMYQISEQNIKIYQGKN